ncbi:ribosomal protein S18-alanine N-acetyltransferase [Rarobacter faecitabidus]|uniref:Ribosomal-protein-alanine N-acetyltransferase n=1 Tax=Rarobacter faecitabidus TaxID=13243 RepID=A0A542ZXG4_RARFA|nr:ribosomal protein S18-alanine N-acetyltransferase [Rarobacter faecitabidus]TQL65047.1 ribosomal-protein-alanine N-acetyltransferase [Rarobacter faecitabidus]
MVNQPNPSGKYSLRAMRASDLDRAIALEVTLFGNQAWSYGMLAEELGGPGRWYIVATYRDLASIGPEPVVGYAGLWFDGEVTQIMTVGVDPHHQGRGAGRRLIEALIARSREVGASAVLLEVAVHNEAALHLYASYGFEQLGLRKRYYQPGDVDAYTMRLDLAP